MIKGCHKRIVFLKDTESELFDEAYFILKPNAIQVKESDLITEATRIVNGLSTENKQKKKRLPPLFIFAAGLLAGTLIMLTVHLILI